jgi:hypothetical protein
VVRIRKAKPKLEKVTEQAVLRWVKLRWPGMKIRKMNGMGMRSWPDRCFFIPGGKPFFIEFKRLGEEPTKLQAQTIKELVEDGYDVEIHDSAEDAKKAIESRVILAKKRAKK